MTTLDALLHLANLDRLPRTGWILRGVPEPESVAGHVLGACHLALALGPRLELPLDLGRVLRLLLVHDAPEALSGDLPKPASRHLPAGAKQAMERGLAGELLGPLGDQALADWQEFQDGATPEARFAKLCDRLQLGVQLLAYRRRGLRGLEEFEAGLERLEAQEFPPVAQLRDEILRGLAEQD